MKKMNNKKGFTLAELLIVIAIIAILIAIAIPAFSGALDEAKIQTDHANMREAYAMAQAAEMLKTIDVGGTAQPLVASTSYYFQKDGTLVVSTSATEALCYKTQAKKHYANTGTGGVSSCLSSVVCMKQATTAITDGHYIKISVDANCKCTVELVDAV